MFDCVCGFVFDVVCCEFGLLFVWCVFGCWLYLIDGVLCLFFGWFVLL